MTAAHLVYEGALNGQPSDHVCAVSFDRLHLRSTVEDPDPEVAGKALADLVACRKCRAVLERLRAQDAMTMVVVQEFAGQVRGKGYC